MHDGRKERKEVWRDIPGYEGSYKVSDMGRVFSSKLGRGTMSRDGIMRPFGKKNNWYLRVRLRKDNQDKEYPVHALVWMAFRGTRPNGLEINHKDGNKRNNRLENLELITHSENIKHAYNTGLIPPRKGEANVRAVLTEKDVIALRKEYKAIQKARRLQGKTKAPHGTIQRFAQRYGITTTSIEYAIARKTWTHI